jgi:hypothetical protein
VGPAARARRIESRREQLMLIPVLSKPERSDREMNRDAILKRVAAFEKSKNQIGV